MCTGNTTHGGNVTRSLQSENATLCMNGREVIKAKNITFLDSKQKKEKATVILKYHWMRFYKLRLTCFTPVEGNSSKSQLYFVEILETLLLF